MSLTGIKSVLARLHSLLEALVEFLCLFQPLEAAFITRPMALSSIFKANNSGRNLYRVVSI